MCKKKKLERIIRDCDGNDTGVREDDRGAMYIDKKVFFSINKVKDILNELSNSKLVKDIRNRKRAK